MSSLIANDGFAQAEVASLRKASSRNKKAHSHGARGEEETSVLHANIELHRDALNVSQSHVEELKSRLADQSALNEVIASLITIS